jgi:plasmid replication initiation protein
VTEDKKSKVMVTKHNDLVTAAYSLSLAEERLVLAAASTIDPRKPMPTEISVSASYYSDIFDLPLKQSYDQLKSATLNLFEAKITNIVGSGPQRSVHHIRWVQECKYIDGEGRVVLVFSNAIKPYLSRLHSHVTSIDLRRAGKLDSSYSLRFFQLLMQFKKTGWLYMTLEELRKRLELGETYQRLNNLKQRVINPAVAELRDKAGIDISIEWITQGRTTTAMRLSFVDTRNRLTTDPEPEPQEVELEEEFSTGNQEEGLDQDESGPQEQSEETQDAPVTADLFG